MKVVVLHCNRTLRGSR